MSDNISLKTYSILPVNKHNKRAPINNSFGGPSPDLAKHWRFAMQFPPFGRHESRLPRPLTCIVWVVRETAASTASFRWTNWGLEKVYVQAKRWQQAVGRPEVQGFYGALAGQRAMKGVFITTSAFTTQAIDFARSVERIVLVDGQRLAELMIDYEVGVTARTIKVPKLDRDYFDEE